MSSHKQYPHVDNITTRQIHRSQRTVASPRSEAAKTVPRDWEHLIDCSETPWDLPQATEPLRKRREHRHAQHVQRRRRRSHAAAAAATAAVAHSLSPASNGDRQSSRRSAGHAHAHHASSRRGSEHRSRHTIATSSSSSTAQRQPESRLPSNNQPMWDGINNGKWSDQCGARSASPSVAASSSKEGRHSFSNSLRFAKQLTSKLPWKASSNGDAETRRRHSSGAVQSNHSSDRRTTGLRRSSMGRVRGLFNKSKNTDNVSFS